MQKGPDARREFKVAHLSVAPAQSAAPKAPQAGRNRDNRQRKQDSLNPKMTVRVIPVSGGIGKSPENVCANAPFGFRIELCVGSQ